MLDLYFCGREVGLSCAMVEVEQTAESFFSLDFASSLFARLNQFIVDPLMIPFAMLMDHEFFDQMAQVLLPENHHSAETLFLNASHQAFGISIFPLRTSCFGGQVDSGYLAMFPAFRYRIDTGIAQETFRIGGIIPMTRFFVAVGAMGF
ncbi:MAG: hypothetical protein KDC71_14235 [Acidobacteria bacterium]|nr:hypothetical protein [Acidobacteriota bacterium]